VLLRDPEQPRYGVEIAEDGGLPSGSIYPVLIRLEEAGWLESEWERMDDVVERRPPRRYYRLTAEGQKVAREAVLDTRSRLRGLGARPECGNA
jgi:DNA-binding PadR family transcriptional regulator